MTPAVLSAAATRLCTRVVGQLPQQLAPGLTRRTTSPSPTTTAAWGEPAITLVCGAPAGNPADDGYTFDGLRWGLHDIGAARRWTTRAGLPVEVTIPDAYDDQAELLGSLATALAPAR